MMFYECHVCEQGPQCQTIFKSSIFGVTNISMVDRFNKSSHASSHATPDIGSNIKRLFTIPYAMLLTILLSLDWDVSDILFYPECSEGSQQN